MAQRGANGRAVSLAVTTFPDEDEWMSLDFAGHCLDLATALEDLGYGVAVHGRAARARELCGEHRRGGTARPASHRGRLPAPGAPR